MTIGVTETLMRLIGLSPQYSNVVDVKTFEFSEVASSFDAFLMVCRAQ